MTAAEDVPQGRLRQGRGASVLGIHLNEVDLSQDIRFPAEELKAVL